MRYLPILIIAVLIGVFALNLRDDSNAAITISKTPDGLPAIPSAPVAPDFRAYSQKDLRDRYTLINFFASWCTPCAAEMPVLKEMSDQGLVIYGILFNDKPPLARAFLEKYGNPYAGMVNDSDGSAAVDWGTTGVPESFLVDPKGKVVYRVAGPIGEAQRDKILSIINAR